MSTPNNENGGKVGGEIVVVDIIIIDIVPEPDEALTTLHSVLGDEVEPETDLWGRPVPTSLLTLIAPACTDESIKKAVDQWADDVELFHAYPGIPYPAPNGAWLGLLNNVIPSGSDAVKFPKDLAERLKPWIPPHLWDDVVAK